MAGKRDKVVSKCLKVSEHAIQGQILEYLAIRGITAWRINIGSRSGEHKGKRWFVRFGVKGMSDILGFLPKTGRFLAIEVKRPSGKATPEQLAFLAEVNTAGLGFVATCVEDVREHGL